MLGMMPSPKSGACNTERGLDTHSSTAPHSPQSSLKPAERTYPIITPMYCMSSKPPTEGMNLIFAKSAGVPWGLDFAL